MFSAHELAKFDIAKSAILKNQNPVAEVISIEG